jgi:NADP-dependent 3-hydroxy acid dehydrogenase YdfG
VPKRSKWQDRSIIQDQERIVTVNPKAILITGAAGGIGAALARAYAAPGIHLFLGDLELDTLNKLCAECGNLGASAHGCVVDVTDKAATERWIADADTVSPLDLVIANAGISYGNAVHEETAEQIRAVFAVNLDGMLNTVLPALQFFRHRKRGQIGLMSSLAGLRGFPHAPSYCATKGAIRIFGQGLRARVKREGVSVSVIIPAFVKTPMTDANLYRMPRVITADRAASIIKGKLAQDKGEFVFPRPYPAVAWAACAMPPSIMAYFTEFK